MKRKRRNKKLRRIFTYAVDVAKIPEGMSIDELLKIFKQKGVLLINSKN